MYSGRLEQMEATKYVVCLSGSSPSVDLFRRLHFVYLAKQHTSVKVNLRYYYRHCVGRGSVVTVAMFTYLVLRMWECDIIIELQR